MLFLVSACKPAEETTASSPEPERPSDLGCSGGFLKASVYGAFSASLDWSDGDLSCEGMPRPEGQGARLRFAGSLDDRSIAIIIAMPELTRESTGAELASNVTLIEEGNGRFYSTADLNVCLTQIESMQALDADRYSVNGSVYCVSPLAEINGNSSISVSELTFTGLLDWNAS